MRSLGERGMNGSRASRSATTIEDMFSVSDKNPDPICPTPNAYLTIRGGRAPRGVLRFRDFEDGKVAETSTKQDQCEPLKQIRSLSLDAPVRPGRPSARGRGVARTCDGGADSRLPSRSGRRCVTSRAMPAAGINAGRLPDSLGWENLSGAERNLRVRLSETRP
jgi:hypothetical protein